MGNLVFQATLGGQVNLVGPNTASTFNLNVPAVSSTLATLAAQTFAGTQTFTLDAVVNGLTVGKGGGSVSTNTAVGASALAANTTGANSVAMGNGSLATATTGVDNVSVGYYSMNGNNGSYNVGIGRGTLNGTGSATTYSIAVGYQALNSATGNYNTALGAQALLSNSSASYNTAVGYQAGYSNTTGASNAYVGTYAGYYNITGSNNTSLGYGAFTSNGVGGSSSNNTAVGKEALASNTTASNNTAVGYQAGYTNSTGTALVAVGHSALLNNTTGSYNTGIGAYVSGVSLAALQNNTTGQYNIGVGSGALGSNTTASNNTAVGYQAGYSANRTADANGNNTFIGYTAGYSVTTGQNNLLLGYFAGRGGSPSGTLTTESNILCLGDNNIATFYCKQSSINTSDARDKTDIQQFTHGLDWVTQLRPVTYRWDMRTNYENGTPDGTHKESRLNLGLIAQEEIEIEKQFGYATDKTNMIVANINEDGSSYGMNYTSLIPLLINSIKELKTIVDAQAAEITALKTKVGI